ncbi:MAG: L,D-transpeptidase family protein [Gammaproteobacteria bacterium]|jgi:murein L,D-transpeptidase YcbB/YkuD
MWRICFFLLIACSMTANAASLPEALRAELEQSRHVSGAVDLDRLYLPGVLGRFYGARGDIPGWVDDQGALPVAGTMPAIIRASREDGLQPDDYHLQAIQQLLTLTGRGTAPDHRQLATLELLLSDAFLLLAQHELDGRVDPTVINPLLSVKHHSRDLSGLLTSVLAGADPRTTLARLLPDDPGYRELRRALARYRSQAANGDPEPVADGPPLKRGATGPRVLALIRHLETEGDLPLGDTSGDWFGPAVEEAVARFQLRHGLSTDGIAGRVTLAAINRPAAERVAQIRVNLERRRWLPYHLEPRRVVVNIADFRATLFVDGDPVLSNRVIVGKPYRQTPEFSDRIRYLVINPDWDVPNTIAAEDILPAVRSDPGYLERRGFQVLVGWNEAERAVSPDSINWRKVSADRLAYHFRQAPGPANPLGRIKFMFPNRFGVYLHDTPSASLFRSSTRTFSSGCIRVANALGLARRLLELDGGTGAEEKLESALASGETSRIDLNRPLPVHIVYMTAWVDDTGLLQFRNDVYDRDPPILEALDAPLPENPPCCGNASSP